MKKHNTLLHLSFILFTLALLLSCTEREITNPFDPESEILYPKPLIESITIMDYSNLQLFWNSGYEFYTTFKIEKATSNQNSAFHQIAEILKGTWVFTDTLVNADSTYYFRIRGMADDLVGPYSDVTSQNITLSPPSNFMPTPLTDQQIRLDWDFSDRSINIKEENHFPRSKETTGNSGYDFGFIIERKDGSGDYSEICSLDPSIHSFTDDSLYCSINYSYRICTFLNQTISAYSELTTSTITLQIPTNLSAEPINDQSIQLSWIDNCPYETGYKIERKDNAGDFEEIAEVDENITTFQDDGLNFGSTYQYRIRTFTSLNLSTYSNVATIGTIFPFPENLTATPLNDQQIELQWDYSLLEATGFFSSSIEMKNRSSSRNLFEEGFSIERKIGTANFIEVGTTEAGETQFIDENLSFETEYTYRVRAFTTLNVSGYSNEVIAFTVFPSPDNLTTDAENDQEISLNWDDNCAFEDGYRIERKQNGGSFSIIAELPSNAASFLDTGLLFETNYTYRVRAFTDLNESAYSNEASTATIFPPPDNLIVEVYSDQAILLTWNDNCTFEDGFRIERMDNGNSFEEIASVLSDETTYLDEALELEITYNYRVRAYTSLNNSYYTNEASTVIIMDSPTNLEAEPINDQSALLTWEDNCSVEQGYIIERKHGTGNFSQIATVGEDATSFTDSGLIFGYLYTYRVIAYGILHNSDYSNEAEVETFFLAPDGLIVTLISDIEVELVWNDNCEFETGYAIERRDAGSGFVQIDEVGADVTSYYDLSITYGMNYTYRVRAFTDVNYSDYTNEDEVLIEIAAPTNLTATVIVDAILLEWDDNSSIEDGFHIERRTSEEDFEIIASVGENIETFTDTTAEPSIMYYYRVCAYTAYNQSEYSNIASAIIIPDQVNKRDRIKSNMGVK